MAASIGIVNESSLHAELKKWYGEMGDQYEIPVDGYLIDIVRGDLLIEIQTSHFSTIRNKLIHLLPEHPIRLVYPIAKCKWILRYAADGSTLLGRRKSPKHGRIEHLFAELKYIPRCAIHPNFSLEVIFTEQVDIWKNDGRGSWRRGYWSLVDRKLQIVESKIILLDHEGYLGLLPEGLPDPFTSQDLGSHARIAPKLAQNMLYCLRKMDLLSVVGMSGRRRLYSVIVNETH